MRKSIFTLIFAVTCCSSVNAQNSKLEGFKYIRGGTFKSGDIVTDTLRPQVRVDDFEILDHSVTNAEYKRFTDATNYPVPLHWKGGQIPLGKEDYPVIFVNRKDVDEYLNWLSGFDGKVYRLPTTVEFEYASRGGLTDLNRMRNTRLISEPDIMIHLITCPQELHWISGKPMTDQALLQTCQGSG